MSDYSIDDAWSEGPIPSETEWRVPPERSVLANGKPASVVLSRWRKSSVEHVEEHVSDAEYDTHVLTIRLRRLSAELFAADRLLWKGTSPGGELFMTGPKHGRWRALTYGKFDHLRVYLPQDLIRECYEHIVGTSPPQSLELFETAAVNDEGLRQLAYAFQTAELENLGVGRGFVDALGVAFAGRLIAVQYGRHAQEPPRSTRANRPLINTVTEYIEEHLGQELYLSRLSEVGGLTRFQLVEQFKAITGLSPYAYVLQRRILRAQDLLRCPSASIVGIALDLGFSSQAHFTDAFRKAVGVTPGEWRRSRLSG